MFRGKLDDHVAFMGRLAGLVLDVQPSASKKGLRKSIRTWASGSPSGGSGFVLLELRDQECRFCRNVLRSAMIPATRRRGPSTNGDIISSNFRKQKFFLTTA